MTALDVGVAVSNGGFSLEAAFSVASGATAVVIGPNGAGKTTLLNTVAGLLRPDDGRIVAGDVVWDDVAAGVHLPAGRRNCGHVFQDLRLFPFLTAVDNVAFGLRARGVRREAARSRARDVMALLEIRDLASRAVGELSGGEKQRVALARALAIEPPVLLLDEGLAALDARMQAETRPLLRQACAAAGVTSLVVTHDLGEAFALGDLFVVVEAGAVRWTGAPGDLAGAPASPFIAALTGVNVFRGVLRRRMGSTCIEATGGSLVVADNDLGDGTPAVATFSSTAVTVATAAPSVSARNVFTGVVSEVVVDAGLARIAVDVGWRLRATLTAQAAQQLQLRPGMQVWAFVKATEIRVEVR